MKLFKHIILSMLLIVNCSIAYCATTSLDNVFVANDVYSSDFYSRLNRNFQQVLNGGVNNIESANIADDTLKEADMADEINPRIRTYEAAGCEKVYSGLLPVTSASLTANTAAGTAYPLGYRVNKASSTAHTYTASKWTWVDIDINGDFQYSEVAINGATPSVASNSIRLAKVSTDSTTVNTVTDLRTTSCSQGAFNELSSAPNEANLDEVLKTGAPMIKRWNDTNQGWQQGLQVSWDSATVFRVKAGSAYINGKYRISTGDITVTTTADDPSNGVSGIVTGAIAGGTKYNIYAVADQDSVKTYSISYGTTATGLTNYRKIGDITTDAGTAFSSRDINYVNSLAPREILKGFVHFNGAASSSGLYIKNSLNVSSFTDNGTGDYTITWDNDFSNANYAVSGSCWKSGGTVCAVWGSTNGSTDFLPGTYRFETLNGAASAQDAEDVSITAFGD